MALFGDVGKFFSGSPVDTIANIVTLGGYGVTKGTLKLGAGTLGPAVTAIFSGLVPQPKRPNTIPQRMPVFAPGGQPVGPPVNVSYGAPTYYGGGGGGSYDAYSYQPAYNPYVNPYAGGQPWVSSTPSFQPLTMPYPVSSAPADRTWEDLAIATLPLLL